ncbi:hypothetical protein NP233_g4583 [Leucocoprinus birnbaumii]|uniref:Uncharacterized protein n=1 Tax=Leucocoprinus birnbaumii TaxID=56174 RepID=A0AAD5VUG2_9AGAR|nr:hypothetical protein NP233_g4583 [Leucocoprinus birnbaumii]
MQCIWRNLARSSSNGPGRVSAFFPRHSKTLNPSENTLNRPRNHSTATPAPPVQTPSPPHKTPSLFPDSTQHTPPSRLALSACHAVHIALKEHSFEDAFTIVNTVRYASLPDGPRQDKAWESIKRLQVDVPPGVSARLPAHALLHGLVRSGLLKQASHLAISMMTNGMRVRGKTLERITDSLAKAATVKGAASKASDTHLKNHMASLLASSDVLLLHNHKPADPHTDFAMRLWLAARKSRSHRSRAMFNTLITLCLINGEIIVASLLFCLLVKDYEAKSKSMTARCVEESHWDTPIRPFAEAQAEFIDYMSSHELKPLPETLRAIVSSVEVRFEEADPNDVDTPAFQAALQSLALLGTLLNDRLYPFSDVEYLIKALYSCPKVENWVWIMGIDGPAHVPAYLYYQGRLSRLIRDLPTHQLPDHTSFTLNLRDTHSRALRGSKGTRMSRSLAFTPCHPKVGMQPPLGPTSYNALLHYALRRRFSPTLANRILKHMTVQRQPPIRINAAVRNILQRSAALHREKAMGGKIAELLLKYGIKPLEQEQDDSSVESQSQCSDSTQLPSDLPLGKISEDPFTLSTYLSNLIALGQPKLVIEAMRRLLPFFAIDHEKRRGGRIRHDVNMKSQWRESIELAMCYGPKVLSVFLQALAKECLTREASSLFTLISCASHASLDPRRSENRGGKKIWRWHVPVSVFTQTLQAYQIEFVYCCRHDLLREDAMANLMHNVTIVYYLAKRAINQDQSKNTKLDSRFYNAMLKTLSFGLPVRCHSIREARKKLVQYRHYYAKTGFFDARGRIPLLDKVITDMTSAGYPIPIGFHNLFLADGIGVMDSSIDLPEFDLPAVGFPESFTNTPYTLPVYRRKLLPPSYIPGQNH